MSDSSILWARTCMLSSGHLDSCWRTSGCKPAIWQDGMYGGFDTIISNPLSSNCDADACLVSRRLLTPNLQALRLMISFGVQQLAGTILFNIIVTRAHLAAFLFVRLIALTSMSIHVAVANGKDFNKDMEMTPEPQPISRIRSWPLLGVALQCLLDRTSSTSSWRRITTTSITWRKYIQM